MFKDIKLFPCWKLYLLRINKPSRWKRWAISAISEDQFRNADKGTKKDARQLWTNSSYLA